MHKTRKRPRTTTIYLLLCYHLWKRLPLAPKLRERAHLKKLSMITRNLHISGLCITLCLWKWKNYLNHCKLILLVTYSSYEFIFQVSSSQFSPLMNDRTLMKRPDVAFSLMRWPWTWSFVQTGQIGYKDISTLLLPYWRFVCELRLAKISKTKLSSVAQPFPMYRTYLVLLCKPNIIRFGETLEFEFACKVDFNQKTWRIAT